MKRLVSILLLVFAVATGFAQSSTPDYIQKAKVGLNQYYPQFKDYFEPIFADTDNLSLSGWKKVINKKIQENFDIFDEEITTERDKCATILTTLDDLLGDKTFKRSKKHVDTSDGEDLINSIASEIASDIKVQFSRELRESRERLANEKERLANEKERLANEKERLANEKERLANEKERLANEKARLAKEKERSIKINNVKDAIKKVKDTINASNSNTKQVLLAIEDLFDVSELSDVKESPGTQEIIKHYISISQKANHTPSPTAQKFIDEYNRITKSK